MLLRQGNLFIVVLLFLIFCGCHGPRPQEKIPDISEYKKAANQSAEPLPVNIVNSDFSKGEYGWTMTEGFKIDKTGGINGTPCMFYERTNPGAYPLLCQTIKAKAGKRYKYGVWVRGEDLLHHNDVTLKCIAIDLFKDGKYIGGAYSPKPSIPGKDWQYAEGELLIEQDCDASLVLYMERLVTGKLWFDNVEMKCIDFDSKAWTITQLYPKFLSLYPDEGKMTVRVDRMGVVPGKNINVYAELIKDGQVFSCDSAVPDKEALVNLDFGKDLAAGKADINLKVLDTEKELIVAEKVMPVTICQKQNPGPGVCLIDKSGRVVVDGNPYLPVGLFVGSLKREDIKRIAASPFNCLMSYSISLKFPDSKKEGLDAVREVLDELAKNNIKVIYSIKDLYDGHPAADRKWKLYGASSADESVRIIVNEFKDHPAILAWYICDEMGIKWVKALEERRSFIYSLDRKHPVWSVVCSYNILPLFASTCDVVGVDPYPIKTPGKHDMKLINTAMDAANTTFAMPEGAAIWGCPQFYNMANYDKQANGNRELRAKYSDPTEDEMRAMCLLMAIRGAKGFMGYSYFDLFTKDAMPDADKRWPEVCRVGEMLKELAPFLLSEKEGPAITVEMKHGEVFAKAFTDDNGNVKVLIAGIGPGKSEAIINVPQNMNLKSRFGGTKLSSPGKYLFQGNDICSDILE